MNLKILGALALMLTTALAHAELPKEVALDLHIRSAASHFKNQQYQQCLEELDKAEQLSGGKLSSDLLFIRAKSNLELNRFDQAKQYATRYIELEGKKGRYYDQTLELFIAVDERIQAQEQQRKDNIANLVKRARDADGRAEKYRYYKEAAELGDAKSMAIVADDLKEGSGVDRNFVEAVSWYEKAIKNGHVDSKKTLGEIYYWGASYWRASGVPKDRKRAFQLFDGFTDAKSAGYLAEMYLFGDGTDRNVDKGLQTLKQYAVNGYKPFPELYLAYLYASGSTLVGGKRDGQVAMEWFQKAIKSDKYLKHRVMLYCYETGFCGAPAEPEKARVEYESAIETIEKGVALYDRYSSTHVGIGRIELQRGAWKDAERAFRCAVSVTMQKSNQYTMDCVRKSGWLSDMDNRLDNTAYLYLAMIHATSKDSSQRSVQSAQESFSKAKGGAKWFAAMVNAAILAESGDFDRAVAKQQEAIALAGADGTYTDLDLCEWGLSLRDGFGSESLDRFLVIMFNRSVTGSFSEYWREYLPEQLASYQQKKPWRYAKQEGSGAGGAFDPFNL